MITKYIWIVAGALITILLIAGIVFYTMTPASVPSGTPPVTFPTVGNTQANGGGSLSVAEIQQGSISVRDFISDPTTQKDPQNDGYYFLAGGVRPAFEHPPYQVFYDQTHQYFGITLYQEPLGQYRRAAEQLLQKELGISGDQMCRLNYFIGVAPGVNDLYLTKNLGFSFCPGATALPQ